MQIARVGRHVVQMLEDVNAVGKRILTVCGLREARPDIQTLGGKRRDVSRVRLDTIDPDAVAQKKLGEMAVTGAKIQNTTAGRSHRSDKPVNGFGIMRGTSHRLKKAMSLVLLRGFLSHADSLRSTTYQLPGRTETGR